MSLNYDDATNSTYWTINNAGDIDVRKNNTYMYDSGSVLTVADITGGVRQNISLNYDYNLITSTTTSHTTYNNGTGVSVKRQADILTDGSGVTFLRLTETVTNTGSADRTFALDLGDDMYADSSTTLTTTSSGDASYATGDGWYETSSSSSSTYPQAAHIVSGGNAAVPVIGTRIDTDSFQTEYQLNLAAGASATIVHFVAMGNTQASATAQANALAALPSYALTGLTAAQLDTLVNYQTDVTSATTTTLQPYQGNLTLTGSANIDGTGNARDNVLTGNGGVNLLTGLDGNDTLDGKGGADRLVGGKGNDVYIVDATDTVVENNNEGVDTIRAAVNYSLNTSARAYVENLTLLAGAATASGNASSNVLVGNAAANTLTGLAGDDTLDGGAGKDRLVGGLDNDTYIVDDLGDVVVEALNQGADTIKVSVSGYTLQANVENLTLTGNATTGTGNTLDNVLTGNDKVNVLSGGIGNDTYVFDQAADQAIETANQGTDTVVSSAASYTLSANVENLTLAEGTGALRATGNDVANALTGNSGNNTLDGRGGGDTMSGGDGSDTYVVDSTADVVLEAAGQGTDTVRTSLATYTLGANVENGVMLSGGMTMTGNILNNALTGNSAANTLNGLEGNDNLQGGGGNDTLNGGDGNDVLVGDSGGPDSVVASGTAHVGDIDLTLNLSAPEIVSGSVVLSGSISTFNLTEAPLNVVYVIDHSGSMNANFQGTVDVGDRNGDGLSNTTLDAAIASFESLNASITTAGLGSQVRLALVPFESGAVTAYTGSPVGDSDGNGVADVIDAIRDLQVAGGTDYTAALQNTLDFLQSQGTGRNLVFFVSDGQPNDSAYLTSILPAVRSTGQGGTLIRAIGTGTGASEEVLDILDDGISNDSAEIVLNPEDLSAGLTGSFSEVTDGAFVEIYRNGTLVQVIGSDEFTVTPLGIGFKTGALSVGASGTDTFKAVLVTSDPNGTTVTSTVPVKIGAFISNDILNGGIGNDTLDGGVGADRMDGGTGDDTFFVENAGDVVIEATASGTDTVISRLLSYTLTENVENLALSGSAVIGTGNALANTITGSDGNNQLRGGGESDTLVGGLGNDLLDGGADDDSMTGGLGDDSYIVDNIYDTVNESSNQGVDTVTTVFNSSLGSSVSGVSVSDYYYAVENLVLAPGSSATIGIGNDFDNFITGNANANNLYGLAGNDTIDGGAGADRMDGAAGNDTYFVAEVGDVVIDSSGVDTVISSLSSYTLGAGIEKLTLAAAATARTAIGNADANILTGNAFNNTLNGMAGADTMSGGLGNDTYFVDNVSDKVIEVVNGGIDTVIASTSHKLAANVENLTLTGSGSFGISGNDLANILTGNNGANRILGLDGNDTINGGLGNDTLFGGAGNDIFVFSTALGSGNVDHIAEFTAFTTPASAHDSIRLSMGIFTALTTAGELQANAFKDLSTAAVDADDRILYDRTTGILSYDADGSGVTESAQFAVLDTKIALTYHDFLVA